MDAALIREDDPFAEGRLLFLDGEALVIDKPGGLAVDRPRAGGPSVAQALPALRFGFQRPPTIVHRLDRDTSGCLLLARNPKAHRRFADAFEKGAVTKTYLAILDGMPEGEEGVIALPLAKRSTREEGWRIVVDRAGRPAVTGWRLLGSAGGQALVAFTPATGRTHQLRVHAASGLGRPIVGDPVYGHGGRGGGGAGMRLHAWKLALPRERKPPVRAEAPLPPGFEAFAGMLGDAAG